MNGSFVIANGDLALTWFEFLRRGNDLPKGDLADVDCAFMLEGERGISGEGTFDGLEDMIARFVTRDSR